MLSKNNNITLFLIILVIIIFFLFVLPYIDKKYYNSCENMTNIIKNENLICNKNCCIGTQWKIPHMESIDKSYTPTNMMCKFNQDSGCICMNKEQFNYLSSRANNI